MPSLYNGTGTWYWGRTNLRTRLGACEFCRKVGQLQSYDTTKFFVFVLVPIIPLGRKRVFDECPYCRRHRVTSLKKFRELREREVGTAAAELSASPANEQKAVHALMVVKAYDADEQFPQVARLIERSLAQNPAAQAALASAYAYFGQAREAESAYLRSLKLRPSSDVQEALATFYLQRGRPDDARAQLQSVLVSCRSDKLPMLYLVVECYQSLGTHADALGLLGDIAAAFPAVQSDAAYNRYWTDSERHLSDGKPLKPRGQITLGTGAPVRRPLLALIPRLIAPALVILLAALYFGAAYHEGRARTVYVVNGLRQPYDVDVAGQRVHLLALHQTAVEVPEGSLTISVPDAALAIPPQTCRIETPFWKRPVLRPTFVINPDRFAVIVEEKTTYVPTSTPTPPNPQTRPHHLYVGQLLYEFSKIDYVFEGFPDKITSEEGTSALSRTRVGILDVMPDKAARLISKELGPAACGAFVRHHLQFNPEDTQFMGAVLDLVEPADAVAMLRPKLAVRPVLVDVHRKYQDLVGKAEPNYDLYAEYRQAFEKEPQNADLAALLARAAPQKPETQEVLARSAEAYTQPARAALVRGDYKGVLELVAKAREIAPETPQLTRYEMDALMGLGNYQALLPLVRAERKKRSADFALARREVQLLSVLNQNDAAERVAATFTPPPDDTAGQAARRAQLSSLEHYASTGVMWTPAWDNDAPPIDDTPQGRFAALMTRRFFEKAADALSEIKGPAADEHLLLYVMGCPDRWISHNYTTINLEPWRAFSELHLRLAISAYKKGGPEERRVAEWLAADNPPDLEQVRALDLLPDRKRIVAVALGMRFPQQKLPLFKLGHRLNFDRGFPYRTLDEVIVAVYRAPAVATEEDR